MHAVGCCGDDRPRLDLIHNHQREGFCGGEHPAAEAGIRQGEIMLQYQGAIGFLQQDHGVCGVVGVAIDQASEFGIGPIDLPGPWLGVGSSWTAADGLGCTHLPASVTAQIEPMAL